ncbi:uncharacterized protein LOC128682225 isoform X3 [Plodia interpunctella]|uniref:uncharacterized protein LOC128682225 isoform X3 n=1 Tax=Plodia interpunctella TaxID=58824 RepID=UPI002367AD7E|nr:uncharacterized protein LOC128682225 isoform X3 [Plodia interpunctella]
MSSQVGVCGALSGSRAECFVTLEIKTEHETDVANTDIKVKSESDVANTDIKTEPEFVVTNVKIKIELEPHAPNADYDIKIDSVSYVGNSDIKIEDTNSPRQALQAEYFNVHDVQLDVDEDNLLHVSQHDTEVHSTERGLPAVGIYAPVPDSPSFYGRTLKIFPSPKFS